MAIQIYAEYKPDPVSVQVDVDEIRAIEYCYYKWLSSTKPAGAEFICKISNRWAETDCGKTTYFREATQQENEVIDAFKKFRSAIMTMKEKESRWIA